LLLFRSGKPYNRGGGNVSRAVARAFTLTDFCILLAVLALLCGGAIPQFLARTREPVYRAKCASNLRQIGQVIQMYALANGGSLPRTQYDGQGAPPVEYTSALASDPFAADGPGPNDVTAPLLLLLRTTPLGPEVFVCPTAPAPVPWDFAGKTPQQVSNFPGRQFLSYSYLNMYPTPAATAAGFNAVQPPVPNASFAIAADMNPGGPAVTSVTPTSPRQQMAQANSRNHNGDGQNVL
jgi:type II secretory pathway pseudopilin PulG